MLCTGILQLSGPSKRLLFRMHSCISIHRNSLHGPPASTAGSPTNVIRICEVKGNPLLKVASASSQTWRRRTMLIYLRTGGVRGDIGGGDGDNSLESLSVTKLI